MARTDTLNNYLTDVAQAIKTKKGDNTPIKASDFDKEIENLPTGGDSFIPNPTWWDIEKIIKEDTEDYPAKIIFLIPDYADTLTIKTHNTNSTLEKIKTSDGSTYVYDDHNTIHTWDKSQDKQSNEGYKTRYMIYYFNDTNVYMPFDFTINQYTLYVVLDNVETTLYSSDNVLENYNNLLNYKLLNNAKLIMKDSYICNSCYALTYIHDITVSETVTKLGQLWSMEQLRYIKLDFSNITSGLSNAFSNCRYLIFVDLTSINRSIEFNSTHLTPDCLRLLIDQLVDNTGNETVYTLTIGTINLKKLTDEDIQKATDKNWEIK